jgi:hypothetical protein
MTDKPKSWSICSPTISSSICHTLIKTLKKRLSVNLIALAAGLAAAGAYAQDPVGIEADTSVVANVDFGILCPTGETVQILAPDTTLGFIDARDGPHAITLTTQVVPAVRGLSFGVTATNISGATLSSVTFQTKHPPFPGHLKTIESYQALFEAGDAYFDYFTFDYPYEMQTGTWEFSAQYAGKVLYRAKFEIVAPEIAPDLANICPGPPLLG